MTQHETHRKQYYRAREAFDDLKIEDRAVFLLEATVATVARGVEEVGRALADELDRFFRSSRTEEAGAPRSTGTAAPGPAEPPTAARTAPRTRKKRKGDDDAESPSA